MMRKSIKDVMFALRLLMEKYREGLMKFRCVFVDVEKADDNTAWMNETYVRVVQDMYQDSESVEM